MDNRTTAKLADLGTAVKHPHDGSTLKEPVGTSGYTGDFSTTFIRLIFERKGI